MFVVVWEFTVNPAHRADFDRAYGPDGDWARLFRRCEGYVATELLRDAEQSERCLTLDYWRLPDHYVAGMAKVAADYLALDARGAGYTVSERRLGNFVSD
jgi:heme-degrading monooxygenase HmoA